jgi:hypothetical protein
MTAAALRRRIVAARAARRAFAPGWQAALELSQSRGFTSFERHSWRIRLYRWLCRRFKCAFASSEDATPIAGPSGSPDERST